MYLIAKKNHNYFMVSAYAGGCIPLTRNPGFSIPFGFL
jgi:hypothetical protein